MKHTITYDTDTHRLVPVEPTQHMMDQGAQATLSWETGAVWPDSWGSDAKRYIKEAGKTYRAMIDAAKEQGK